MGCDIHTIIQFRQYPDNEDWNPAMLGICDDPRNYPTFGMLAGVRGRSWTIPIFSPRGLPQELSRAELEYFDNMDDLHNVSWITLKEAKEYYEKYRDVEVDDGGKKIKYFEFSYFPKIIECMEFVKENWGNEYRKLTDNCVRLVFGFDN